MHQHQHAATSSLTWSRRGAGPPHADTPYSSANTHRTLDSQNGAATSVNGGSYVADTRAPPVRLAALRQLLRSSGTGGSAAFLAGSVDATHNNNWVNDSIDRRDTVATVELRSLRAYHVDPADAVLEITVVPNHPNQSFPAACIVSVSTNQQRSSDEFANADVVIKEWKLMTTTVSLPRTTISMRTVMNIASVVRQQQQTGEDDDADEESTRVFLTLRFAGCCDMSNRHCIQQVHLVYLAEAQQQAHRDVDQHHQQQVTTPWSEGGKRDQQHYTNASAMAQRAALASVMENVVMSPPPSSAKRGQQQQQQAFHTSTTRAANLNDSVDMHVHVEDGRKSPTKPPQYPGRSQYGGGPGTTPSVRAWSPGQGSVASTSSASFFEQQRKSISPRRHELSGMNMHEPSFIEDTQSRVAAMSSRPTYLGGGGGSAQPHFENAQTVVIVDDADAVLTPAHGATRRPRARVRVTTPEKFQHDNGSRRAAHVVEEPAVVEIMTSPCGDSVPRRRTSGAHNHSDDGADDGDEGVVVLAISPVVGSRKSPTSSVSTQRLRAASNDEVAYEVLLDEDDDAGVDHPGPSPRPHRFQNHDDDYDHHGVMDGNEVLVHIEASPHMLTPRRETARPGVAGGGARVPPHHSRHHGDEDEMTMEYAEMSPMAAAADRTEHAAQLAWSPAPAAPPPSFSSRLHSQNGTTGDTIVEASTTTTRPQQLAALVKDVENQMLQRRSEHHHHQLHDDVEEAIDASGSQDDSRHDRYYPQHHPQQVFTTTLQVPSRQQPQYQQQPNQPRIDEEERPLWLRNAPLPPPSPAATSSYLAPHHPPDLAFPSNTASQMPLKPEPTNLLSGMEPTSHQIRMLDLHHEVALALAGNVVAAEPLVKSPFDANDSKQRVDPKASSRVGGVPAGSVSTTYELPDPLTTSLSTVVSKALVPLTTPSSVAGTRSYVGNDAAAQRDGFQLGASSISRPLTLPSRTSFVSVKQLRSSSSCRSSSCSSGASDPFHTSDDDDGDVRSSSFAAAAIRQWGAPRRPAPILSDDAMAEARRSVTAMEKIPEFVQQTDIFEMVGGVLGVEPQAISRSSSRRASRATSPITSRSATPVAAASIVSQLPSAQARNASSSAFSSVTSARHQGATSPVVFTSCGAGIVAPPTPPLHSSLPPKPPQGAPPPSALTTEDSNHTSNTNARFQLGGWSTSAQPQGEPAPNPTAPTIAAGAPRTTTGSSRSLYDEDEDEDRDDMKYPPQEANKGQALLHAAYKVMVDAISTTTAAPPKHTLQPAMPGKHGDDAVAHDVSVPTEPQRPRSGSVVSVPPVPQTAITALGSAQPATAEGLHRTTSWARSSSSTSNHANISSYELLEGQPRMIPTKLQSSQTLSNRNDKTTMRHVDMFDEVDRSQRAAPSQPHAVRWNNTSNNMAPTRTFSSTAGLGAASAVESNPWQAAAFTPVVAAAGGQRRPVSTTAVTEEQRQPQQQRPHYHHHRDAHSDAAAVAPPSKDVLLWCHKHHTSRNGTGRRCLLLHPTPDGEGVTFTMRKPDGSSWKGPAVPIQSPQALIDGGGGLGGGSGAVGGNALTAFMGVMGGGDATNELTNTVLLERSAHISVLTGVDAYNSPSIHQNRVRCAANCVVVLRKGRLVASLEFDSEQDVHVFLNVLACVTMR